MEPLNEVVLITQARLGSTRLPGKILLKVNGEELLKIHLARLSKCKKIDQLVVATTTNIEDVEILNLCMQWGYQTIIGSVNDVLDRYYQVAKLYNPKWIVRVTSDCPLIDPQLVDAVIALALVNNVDYCSNVMIENFPDGQDIEVFKFAALERAWKNAILKSDREHVTPYIRNNANEKGESIFSALNFPCFGNFSSIRMTVDEERDFELIEKLISDLGIDKSWLSYTNYIIDRELYLINSDIIRNEGLLKSIKND